MAIRHRSTLFIFLPTLAALFGITVSSATWAHAILVKSQPVAEAELAEAPKRVDVWFNDKVGSEYKALAVIDSSGKRVDNKDVQQETFDHSHLYATTQALPPGAYTVRYRVVSADTHIVTGKFKFFVKAP